MPVNISFLMATAKTSFESIRKRFVKNFELANHDFLNHHYVTKYKPKFESGILNIDKKHALLTRKI